MRVPLLCRRAVLPWLVGVLLPPAADAQDLPPAAKPPAARYPALLERDPGAWAALARQGALASGGVQEQEPNDDFATANSILLGDRVDAVIDPSGDVDFFAVELPAGRFRVEIEASAVGSPLDSYLTLYFPSQALVDANDDCVGLDSCLEFNVSAPERYYLAVADLFGRGGGDFFYSLRIEELEPGPGDTPTLLTPGLHVPWGMAAGPVGELYVADFSGTLWRIHPTGERTVLMGGLRVAFDVAVDGFGDLLVTLPTAGMVLRFDPVSGDTSTFAGGLDEPLAITVGPDGDVWVAEGGRGRILRFGPRGEEKGAVDLTAQQVSSRPVRMAFSPDGRLHYSDGSVRIFRVDPDRVRAMILGEFAVEGFAFDRDGYLYVANGYRGRVDLYRYDYSFELGGFATRNIGGPSNVVFLRNPDGSMSNRIAVSNQGYRLQSPFVGSVVVLNPAGVRAPGMRVGVDLLTLAADSVPRASIGSEFSHRIRVVEAVPGVVFSLASGELPPGLTLRPDGVIEGIPEQAGAFEFEVGAEGGGRFGFLPLSIEVERPSVSVATAINALLGVPGVLNVDEERFLDIEGNGNGRLDVGDLRLFLEREAKAGAPVPLRLP